jgi:glycosyltransferase involved in cell wall biosynthesis
MPQNDTHTDMDWSYKLRGRRILFVVNVDWFFLSHRLPIALGAKQAGADVWVASADTGRSQDIVDAGLHFVPLSLRRNSAGIIGEVSALAGLAMLYWRLKPDIVHHVTIKPILYGSIATALYRIPTINAISGFGHSLGREGSRALSVLIKGLYRLALRNRQSYTVFQNDEDRGEFIRQRFLRPERAALIRGSGVDCDLFRPRGCAADETIVMFASRMLREKGVIQFVELARALHPDYPDVRFVLVGQPDDSPTSVTTEQLYRWSDEEGIEWWGHSDRMEQVLPKAAIFVLPTYYREGLPKVLLEAAACGIAIVTTDIPGCRDVVQDGHSGRLVTPQNHAQLVAVVRELLEDDSTRRLYGAQAREVAVSRFSIQQVVRETLSLYRSVLERP